MGKSVYSGKNEGTALNAMNHDTGPRTPGQLIEELLQERGWSKRVLAVILGIGETSLSKIIAGKRPLDAPLALVLGEVFAVPADRFLDLQKHHDLAQARLVARPDPARQQRAHLFGDLPIAEMIKRGWIEAESVRDVAAVEAELTRFFGVESLDEIEILPHAAKKTNVATEVTPTQLAWLYRAKQIASEMIVAPYSELSAPRALKQLKPLLATPTEARKVPRILAEAGIRYVIVESLPGAKIDGACFWLDGKSPVIAMTIRFDRVDNFWFVLRHELEHVQCGHGQIAVIDTDLNAYRSPDDGTVLSEERQANDAAAEFCVPRASLDRFIARKDPFFAERDILGFSKTIGVHPGLVAGQLQHHTRKYNRFRQHLVPIRASVAPSAVVDGWGDVAPVGL